MKAPLATTSSTFQVHSSSTPNHDNPTNPSNPTTAITTTPPRASLSYHPSHPSPAFHTPTSHPHPLLPYLYNPPNTNHYQKKSVASIGYSRSQHLSDDMRLSLAWDAKGTLRRWDRERPYAVREARERDERRRRGEAEVDVKRTWDLWSAFPPLVHPVPAGPADYSIHASSPIAPPPAAAALPAASVPRLSSASMRQQAAALLAAGNAYDPYAAIDNPFFAIGPSNYTAIYATPPPHTSPLPSTGHKPNLTAHPAGSYAISAVRSRRRNNRWTEERLFFRGYSTSGSDEGGGAMAVRPQRGRDLLFEQPMYSSFAMDGVYREPQRRRGVRKQRWTKVDTPRMRPRRDAGGDTKGQADDGWVEGGGTGGGEVGGAGGVGCGVGDGMDGGGGGGVRCVEKVEIRLSGVFVPRVNSRFIPSTSLPLCKPRWD